MGRDLLAHNCDNAKRESGKPGGRRREPSPGRKAVLGSHLEPALDRRPLPQPLEVIVDALSKRFWCRGQGAVIETLEYLIPPVFSILDGGPRNTPTQGHRDRGIEGERVLGVTNSPVLDKGDVRGSDGRELAAHGTVSTWSPSAANATGCRV